MLWYFKQLFPLPYQTHYKNNNNLHFTKWWMWFGKCFCIKDRILNEQ